MSDINQIFKAFSKPSKVIRSWLRKNTIYGQTNLLTGALMQVLQLFLDKFILKCKLQMKTNKNERGILRKVEFGLTEMCFPSLGLGHKYKLIMVLRQYYPIIIGCFSFFKPKIREGGLGLPSLDPPLFSYIERSHDICWIIWNRKPGYKKNCNDALFLLASNLNICLLSSKYPFRN